MLSPEQLLLDLQVLHQFLFLLFTTYAQDVIVNFQQ
ncbi:hypothetical protein MicvaDRAFT_4388 [Microcoleus vaginatus FGP-2]|nr:hypothetical protein MicvaDRAFT_4388 [Microcoleus vaginatus FGP-2]